VDSIDKRGAFIDSLVSYVEADPTWDALNKREGVAFAVRALTSDPGAAQDFLDACGCIMPVCQNCGEPVLLKDPNQLAFDL
jgi:hypothetical protein